MNPYRRFRRKPKTKLENKAQVKQKIAILTFFSLFILFVLVFENGLYERISGTDWNSAAALKPLTSAQKIAEDNRPRYYYYPKNQGGEPKLSATGYVVGDLNTGEVILAKNQEDKFPMASISKLMTAFVAEELGGTEDVATVSSKALATYGGNGNFSLGEKIKLSDILYPLLLESSNDAAEIIAEHFGRESFMRKMNQEAKLLTMSSTTYEDPSGLSPNNKSTATDMFKLAGYLLRAKPEVFKITTQRSYSTKKHNWSSTNQFLHQEGYIGGKSGFTDPALQTGISLFTLPLSQTGGRPIGIVLLHTADRFKDVQNILKYLKDNIYYGTLADANSDWVHEKMGIPKVRDPDFLTLTFLGDIMLDRGVASSVRKNFKGDYLALFEKLAVLKKSDAVFANLEGPASDQGEDAKNLYSFRMDPAVIPALAGAGINVLSVANNHIGDWGPAAFIDTISRLKENEIRYVGGGVNSTDAETPQIFEKYGMKIGYLGFSDQGPESMKAENYRAGILLANNPRFDEIVRNAAKQVDYLVVSFHFGEEYQVKHNDRQEALAHRAADAGAKLVIGAHPHVVQDFETYSPKSCAQSSCVSYIAYSLGNFIFDQPFSQATMQGSMLEVKLNRDGSMSVKKNTVKLNSAFQPNEIIKGVEEKVQLK